MKEVRQCPLCEWKHEAPSIRSAAERYGSHNIMAGLAVQQHMIDIERVLVAHFTTHTIAEWARAVVKSQAETERLSAENDRLTLDLINANRRVSDLHGEWLELRAEAEGRAANNRVMSSRLEKLETELYDERRPK